MERTELESPKGERIAKFLARAGVASRREAERIIEDGYVTVDGITLTTPAFLVMGHEDIRVDGKPISASEPTRMWLYHKPVGLLTTHYDPEDRPTVFEMLPRSMPRVVSVGRLDLNSEGLLLLTTSGELAGKLGHPSLGWIRRYRARIHGIPPEHDLDILRDGVTIDGVHYAPAKIEIERKQGSNCWLSIAVTEGKNREVRRMLEYIDCPVNRLIRVAFGPFLLGDLERGEVKEIHPQKMKSALGSLLS